VKVVVGNAAVLSDLAKYFFESRYEVVELERHEMNFDIIVAASAIHTKIRRWFLTFVSLLLSIISLRRLTFIDRNAELP